jgi:hypothetical protein
MCEANRKGLRGGSAISGCTPLEVLGVAKLTTTQESGFR